MKSYKNDVIHLYIDTVRINAKYRHKVSKETWKSFNLSIHGFILNNEKVKVSSLPPKLKITPAGYERKNKGDKTLRPYSWIDLAIGVKLDLENIDEVINFIDEKLSNVLEGNVYLHINHPEREKVLPSTNTLVGLQDMGDIIIKKLVKKYDMEIVTEEMPKVISKDVINSNCLETLKFGGKLFSMGLRNSYWKSPVTPMQFRYNVIYGLVKDTGRETRTLIYDVEDFVSTEMFSSTVSSSYSYKPVPYYADVYNSFTSYFKEDRYRNLLVEVDSSSMFSGVAKRLYNKFGLQAYYYVLGKRRYSVSSLYLGKFLNNQTKSMQEMKLMELNPRPNMVITRVFLAELYILAIKHILSLDISKDSKHIEYIDYKEVEWDNSFEAIISVTGEKHKMPFVPEVAFHDITFAGPYLNGKGKGYAVAIKSHGIVYQTMVILTKDHGYGGNSGEVPVLIGSRGAKKKELIIKEHKKQTKDWHRKILDTISKEGYAD